MVLAVLRKENSVMASQENDKAMDGLLRRSLARDGDSSSSAKGECPDPELLAAYYDKSLSATEVAALDLHFSQCARCREQIAAIVRADVEVEKDSSTELVPVGAAAPARATEIYAAAQPRVGSAPSQFPTSAKSRDAARRPLLDLRWLAPLAAAIVLAVFVYVRVNPHRAGVASDNKIAMNRQPSASEAQPSAATAPSTSDAAASNPDLNRAARSSAPTKRSDSSSSSPASRERKSTSAAQGGASAASGGAIAPESAARAPKRSPVFHSPEWSSAEAPADRIASTKEAPSEPAPAAPPPQLSSPLPIAVVAANSADSGAAAPPAPPADSAKKSEPAQVTGQAFGYSAGKKSLAKSQPARERSSQIVIRTPDSDVAYRIADGGFIEQTEDGGATWQGQLLNPAADITAGSAPAPSICWLVGRAGVIFLTEDGKNWRKLLSPSSSDFAAVVAKSATSATVTVTEEEKWSTDDAGKTWRPQK
jgi:hypothetical protein